MKNENIPANAFTFVAAVDVKERKNDDSKSTPFTAVARTGDALNHAYFGRVVHDLDGMRVKSRIPIDWNHTDTIVGYANRFDTETGDLEIGGALTPTKFDQTQRAQQIIDQAEQGVPFEMSISFPGDIQVEEVPEGKQVTVNQREFAGPLTVIRDWPLRAVAVTPMGQDAATSLQFSGEQRVSITVINSENDEMSQNELTASEAVVDEKVDEAVDESGTDNAEVEAETVETVDAEKPEVAEVEMSEATDGKTFMDVFGRVEGAVYFAEGLSMEEALQKDIKRLREENAELRVKLESQDDGVSFSQGGEIKSNVLTAIPGEVVDQVPRTT